MSVYYVHSVPAWAMQVTYTTDTSRPRSFVPCTQCGGSGGSMIHVSWAATPQWHTCLYCGGAGGKVSP